MRVMIVVTHLLGTGHLSRAITLMRAFAREGHATCVVSGGTPAPMLLTNSDTVVQLPPVKSDGVDFSRLLTGDGALVDETYLTARQNALLRAMDHFAPDVLITELFPFGRRILRTEFHALLEHARHGARAPLICASIRDILAPPSKPSKADFSDRTVQHFYDAVLVHSDEVLMPLDLSWPVSDTLRPFLHYTGFVSPIAAEPHPHAEGAGDIIVSAGGGDVGSHVYAAAIDAAQLLDRPMRLLIGGANADARIARLSQDAPSSVRIEAARPDFRQMLSHATASVSLCGYNTALDILQAGTPAVFVPFDEGGEVEQGLRAHALSQQDGITVVPRANLTAETLAAAVRAVMSAPARKTRTNFDGAAHTVRLTHTLWEGKCA